MKRFSARRLVCLVVAAPLAPVFAGQIEIGDTRALVIEELGKPDGTVKAGTAEFLHYNLGQVELQDGRVVESTLISQEEYDLREKTRKEEHVRKQAEAATRRQARIQAGTAEKERRLADTSFAASAPADQVKYWTGFQKTYPEVNVTAELQAARTLQAEADAIRKQALAEAEKDKGPPPGMSSKKLRKYKRGRGVPANAE